MRCYLYTPSGPEALLALARQSQKERPFQTAEYYKQLLNHRGPAQWSADDLYHASLVFRAAKDPDAGAITERWLNSFHRAGRFVLADRALTPLELYNELERAGDVTARGFWPMVGGDAARSLQGNGGGLPSLETRWRRPLLRDDFPNRVPPAQKWLHQADQMLEGQVVLPAFQPITIPVNRKGVAQSLVVMRNYSGVEAVDVATGKVVWETPSQWMLENMSSSSKVSALKSILEYYLQENKRPGIVYENSTVGTLSTDGRFVFAVEDFAAPPPQHLLNPDGSPARRDPQFPWGKDLKDAVRCSRLQAYELATNVKFKWEVGGAYQNARLGNAYFLGPPLPYKGSPYVLFETTSPLPSSVAVLCPPLLLPPGGPDWPERRLARLDPNTGNVLANVAIHRPHDRLQNDVYRRIEAAQFAAADGILVVPTNAGVVVGVEVFGERVV